MLKSQGLWITGNSCSGKTTRLGQLIIKWLEKARFGDNPLVLCSGNEGKEILTNTLLRLNPHFLPEKIRTVAGLMREDVLFFYPLLCQELNLPSVIPIHLLSETEQHWATQLWHDSLTPELVSLFGNESDCVRRILDFMLLAATGEVIPEKIVDLFDTAYTAIASQVVNLINKYFIYFSYNS